jgi:hypothetical protein
MAGPPCECINCGFVFSTSLIEIGPNVTGITFQDCSVSCPKCGSLAQIGDGTYNSVGGALALIAGPSSTAKLLKQLSRIASEAHTNKLTAQEVLAEIADVSPDLANKLRGIGSWPTVGLILLLFWIVKSVSFDLKVDFNWLIDQAWHVAHGQDPDRHLNSAPPQFPLDSNPGPASPPFGSPVIASFPPSSPNRHARRVKAAQPRRSRRSGS